MKRIVFILLITSCAYSCEKVVGLVNFNTGMYISVMSSQNASDLLNPNNPKKLDISQVKILYPPDTREYSIEPNGQNGQAHFSFGPDGKHYISFSPAAVGQYTKKQADLPYRIVFKWPDKSEDVIEAYLRTVEQNTYVVEIYLNDSLVWNLDTDKNNTTKRPPHSVTVFK